MAPASQALTLLEGKECQGYFIGEDVGLEENMGILKATENDMTSLFRELPLPLPSSLERLTPTLQDTGQAGREKKLSTDLSSKESTHSDDT